MSIALKTKFDAKWVGEPNTGCWLWTDCLNNNGYGQFHFGGRRGTHHRAHRLSWELHNGPVPEGQLVLHRCDVRSCVNPLHLFLGTDADNMADMIGKRRARHPRKLTTQQVEQIRSATTPQKEIAARFGISSAYVSQIRSRKYRARD